MMNAKAISILSAASSFVLSDMDFPTYEQTFTARFGSPAAAEKATAFILPLPNGKKAAFTSRWDDSNPRHLIQEKTLAKHGLQGSFYLNDLSEKNVKEYFKPILNLGGAVGNHTSGHMLFPHHTPNCLFEKLVLHQAAIESTLDTVSVSFTFPCTKSGRYDLYPVDPNELFGDLLCRAGIFSFPETFSDPAVFLKRPVSSCFGAYLFCPDDRNPDLIKFREGFQRCYEAAVADKDQPRVALGVHTWQSDEGFKVLDGLYGEISKRNDLWFCNENQYAAYRYNFYHAKIEKVSVSGSEATFRIRRAEPAFCGSSSELNIAFSEKADVLRLPDAEGHTVPAKIDLTESGRDSVKFPGVCCTLEYLKNKNLFRAVIRNSSRAPLERMVVTLILPPLWKKGTAKIEVPLLKAGAAFGTLIDPGECRPEELFRIGRISFDLRTDFVTAGTCGRIHTVLSEPYTPVRSKTASDQLLFAGPFAIGAVPVSFLKENSLPGTKLKAPGSALNMQWFEHGMEGWMSYSFSPSALGSSPERAPLLKRRLNENDRQQYGETAQNFFSPGRGETLIAVDFVSGPVTVALDKVKAVFIDGKQINWGNADKKVLVPLEQGTHRLLALVAAIDGWAVCCNGCVCGIFEENSLTPAVCQMPDCE